MQLAEKIIFSAYKKPENYATEPLVRFYISKKLKNPVTSDVNGCYVGQHLTDEEQEACNMATD